MNSFGLGLVLNFVDNASSGIGNATRALQQMNSTADAVSSSVSTSITDIVSASYALDSVGSTLLNAGSSIISMYGDVSQSVIDAGMEMQGYRMQLSALYGSMDAGEAKMEEIKQYAMSSVFDIQSLIPAITSMKSVGIEAMNDITTSSGKSTQKLLDYASDLAAMVPNMHNAYGSGVAAAMGAFKEYIAEGNAMSLKRGAGLDITGLLGEEKGSSIEERTQQIADLIEKLNIVGYTSSLAGTPTQRLSNMQDALFNSLTKIADSGVFERYSQLLEKLSNWVFSIVDNEETFNIVTGIMADTVTSLLSPLDKLLDFVIENSNAIIDWIKANPELTKNILLTVVAVGALLVAGGALLKLISSLGFAFSGLQMLKSLPTLLATVGTSILPIIAVAGFLYGAWSTNLLGIRDISDKVISDLKFLFNNLGSIFSIVSDAWEDNSLSEENFQKANELGILPLITGIQQLKYYWDFFVEGFKTGFTSFFEGLSTTLENLGLVDMGLGDLIKSAKDFLAGLIEVGKEDSWTSMGESLGSITATLMTTILLVKLLTPVIKIVSGIVKMFSGLFNIVQKISPVFSKLVTGVKSIITVLKGGQGVGFFTKLLEVMVAVTRGGMGLKDAMTVVFGSVGTVISGVVSLISGIVIAAVSFIKQLTDGFSWFWEIIKWIGIALAVVGAILLGAATWPAIIVGAIVGALTLIIVLVKQYWNEICAFFSTIASWIYDNVISPVVGFFMTYIYPFVEKIVEIVAKIIEIICALFKAFIDWYNTTIYQPFLEFFENLWKNITTGVQDFITGFIAFFKPVATSIMEFFSPLATFFQNVWNEIVRIFTTIGTAISDAVTGAVKGAINAVLSGAASIINGFIDAINFAIDVINGIPGVSISKITRLEVPQLAEGGVVDKPTLAEIGEAGKEAVVPLENNTEWIDEVAEKVAPKLAVQPQLQSSTGRPTEEHNDYSVTFAAGSIVIQLVNATEAELEKAAEKLMKIIERKQQLKAMAVRA